MKVLHVIPAVAARYGGPSSAIASMCLGLVERGVEPFIAATDADGAQRLATRIGEPTTWAGIPAIFFHRNWSEAYKYSRGLSRWLFQHVADFDVVHVHAILSHAPLAAAAACRHAGVPYIVRPLGTLDPWSLRQKPMRKTLLLALGGRRTLAGAAAIHYTSSEEKRLTEQALGLERGVVIPLGVDEDLLSEPPAGAERVRDPYVLVLSRLHPVKNLESFIDAFAGVVAGPRSSGVPWRLIVAGTGDPEYVARLKRLVVRAGLGDRVSFQGWIEGDAKRQLIRGASLFALPSLHENFGVSLVEALAAGVPALVSRHVHLAEAIEGARAGWAVDSDTSSLESGLLQALSSVDERQQRGAAARELARQFVWPRVADELAVLYRRLCHVKAVQGAPLFST